MTLTILIALIEKRDRGWPIFNLHPSAFDDATYCAPICSVITNVREESEELVGIVWTWKLRRLLFDLPLFGLSVGPFLLPTSPLLVHESQNTRAAHDMLTQHGLQNIWREERIKLINTGKGWPVVWERVTYFLSPFFQIFCKSFIRLENKIPRKLHC